MPGLLITFEGIDGSGKTTLSKRVAEKLKIKKLVLTAEPTTYWTGELVKVAINTKTNPLVELFLFIADHAEHVTRLISRRWIKEKPLFPIDTATADLHIRVLPLRR